MMDLSGASLQVLLTVHTNLRNGLSRVAETLDDGTFHVVGAHGEASPAQFGQLILILLREINAELYRRTEALMPTLTITRGLPACGKTTWARAWVARDPTHRARVNRDDLRAMVHDGVWLGQDTEKQIVAGRDATIRALLRRGVDVVCDDTNLPQRTARDLRRLAVVAGAEFLVVDLSDVPVGECVRRDAVRDRPVGESVIRDMWNRHVRGRPRPLPLADEPQDGGDQPVPYVPPPGAPSAVLVDVDGTVALMAARSPYDETRVREDRPNLPVIAVVNALYDAGHAVVFCSGRTEGCRVETERWLCEHVMAPVTALHMRAVGDTRRDAIVKLELFDRHIRDAYRVVCVLDDRDQVVEMWRALGLTALQVAPGDF